MSPDAARILAASLVGRVPAAALGVLLVLHARVLTGSLAVGGLAAGLSTLAFALSGPALGRACDARGMRPVLAACAGSSLVLLTALAALPRGAPAAAIVALATLEGALYPPLSACLRARWGTLVPDPSARRRAFTLEASWLEATYIVGPIVFVAGLASWSTRAGILAAALCIVAGTAWFAAQVPPGGAGDPDVPRRRPRGLAKPALVYLTFNLAIGLIEVSTVARAGSVSGVLLALWGLGSMLGGVAVARGARAPGLAVLLGSMGVLTALMALGPPRWALGTLLLASGAGIAPGAGVLLGLTDDRVGDASRAEAFAWVGMASATGLGLGTGLGGALASGPGVAAGFLAAAAAYTLAGLAAIRLTRER